MLSPKQIVLPPARNMGQSRWTQILFPTNRAELLTDLWTACRPTDETFSATGAKYHRASLEVNTTPMLIIIIMISFVFIITRCIFVMSFNASDPYQLYGNWALSVKLCKINFDTLSLKCLVCSVSLEWNILIPTISFRENSSPSSCCYPSSCHVSRPGSTSSSISA